MGRQSKRPMQTDEELAMTVRESKRSQLYGGRESTMQANDQRISQIVSLAAAEMAATMDPERRISLHDTAAVEMAIMRYLKACEAAAVVPSLTGLAASCGHGRTSIYSFMRSHPDSPTTEVLRNYSDLIAEILSQTALSGTTHPIASIFLLKARHNFRENDPGELPEPEAQRRDAKTIMDKYSDLPE